MPSSVGWREMWGKSCGVHGARCILLIKARKAQGKHEQEQKEGEGEVGLMGM